MSDVPEEFRAIGFSGLFHLEVDLSGPRTWYAWADKAPCLLPGDKWLLLRIDREAGTAVVVRRDDCAIVDLVRPPIQRLHEPRRSG